MSLLDRIDARLLPLAQLRTAVDKILTLAPYAKIIHRLGLRSAADKRRVRRLRGVSVGSAAINHLSEGNHFSEETLEVEAGLAATSWEFSYDF